MAVLSATENAEETLVADTTNTETMLIEEGAFMRESLQFENDPWTPFYMAGETIRGSRKASGKTKQVRERRITTIIRSRNVGSLPKDDSNVGTGLDGESEWITVDAEENANGTDNQKRDHPDKGWHILAGHAGIRK